MKTSIFIETLEGNHWEVSNTSQSFVELAEEYTFKLDGINPYDVILYNPQKRLPVISDFKVLYRSDNKEISKFIITTIHERLKKKSELLHEIQALKKIKSDAITPIIEKIKKEVREDYFQIKITALLRN